MAMISPALKRLLKPYLKFSPTYQILVYDRNFKIQYVNPEFCREYKYPEKEILGKSILNILSHVSQGSRKGVKRFFSLDSPESDLSSHLVLMATGKVRELYSIHPHEERNGLVFNTIIRKLSPKYRIAFLRLISYPSSKIMGRLSTDMMITVDQNNRIIASTYKFFDAADMSPRKMINQSLESMFMQNSFKNAKARQVRCHQKLLALAQRNKHPWRQVYHDDFQTAGWKKHWLPGSDLKLSGLKEGLKIICTLDSSSVVFKNPIDQNRYDLRWEIKFKNTGKERLAAFFNGRHSPSGFTYTSPNVFGYTIGVLAETSPPAAIRLKRWENPLVIERVYNYPNSPVVHMVIEKSGGVFKVWLNGMQHFEYVDTGYLQYSLHHFTGLILTGGPHYLYEMKLFKRRADPEYIRNATAPFDLRLKSMPDQVFEAEFFPKRLSDEKMTDVYLKRVTDLRKTQKANARLLKQKENALDQVNSELQIAASVLNRLLPKEFPEVPGVTFVSYYKPSGHVGGDLFDVFRVDNDRIAVLMYDVSGHGVPAALISVMTRTLFQKHFHTQQSLTEQLDYMNRDLTRDISGTNFVTLFFGLLNFKAKELKYVGAGFIPPVMVQQDKLTLLNTRGIPLGMSNRITSKEHTMELKPGAKLILYTDGLYEIFNRKNEMYTWKRFVAFISKLKHLPIKTLIQKMVEEHAGFTDMKTPRDDVSLLGIEID